MKSPYTCFSCFSASGRRAIGLTAIGFGFAALLPATQAQPSSQDCTGGNPSGQAWAPGHRPPQRHYHRPVWRKLAFPKLGEIAYHQDYDSVAWQQDIAQFDLAILNFYNGWDKSGLTIQQAVQDIKSYNPSILLGNYTLPESCPNSGNAATLPEYDELAGQVGPTGNGGTWTPNDWFARDNTGANLYDGSQLVTNITAFVTPNSVGDRFPQWYAKWEDSWCYSTTPQFDFIFSDDSFYQPRVDADWNRSGQDYAPSDTIDGQTVASLYRQGMASYWAELNRLEPGMLIMGNPDGNSFNAVGYLRDPEYRYKIGAAVYEAAMGQPYSEESYAGWYLMMDSYQTLLANTSRPHIVMLECAMTSNGLNADKGIQANYGGGQPYAFMRYALATALMENGYFEADPNNYNQNPALWFDEYDLAGTATTHWLGAAIDPPQTGPYQNGIWMRRFQHGMALVNPRTQANLVDGNPVSNSTETVTIPRGYAHFQGTQDPITNNGQPVTSITLQPGDGVLLVKTGWAR
ncbi:MAG: putative glycoside hydrolase [Opitutaceae bacterium]